MRLVVLSFILLLCACGTHVSSVSVLQRYDGLGPQLRALTSADSSASRDASLLRNMMSAENYGGSEWQSSRLMKDSGRLEKMSTSLRSRLWGLERERHTERIVKRYFDLLMAALISESQEGMHLQEVSSEVSSDPFLIDQKQTRKALQAYGAARTDARAAGAWIAKASQWKRAHHSRFLYLKVNLRSKA